jgi:hypothetical protein
MEWSDKHDILLAQEVLTSEPFRHRPRTVERGKVWQDISDQLNTNSLVKFRVTKRSTREHFILLLMKYKAKRKTAMEEIWEKWEAAEVENTLGTSNNKKKMEADRVGGEDVRMKACERQGETAKRKSEETDGKPKKSRRYGGDTIAFLREKQNLDMESKKEEQINKQKEQERQAQVYDQFRETQHQQQQQQTQIMNMMQQQNQAMLALMTKLAEK